MGELTEDIDKERIELNKEITYLKEK